MLSILTQLPPMSISIQPLRVSIMESSTIRVEQQRAAYQHFPMRFDNEAMGKRLREARERRGWGSSELDLEADVGKGSTSRIERAQSPEVSLDVVARLAFALGLRLDWLVYGTGPIRDPKTMTETPDPKAGVFLRHIDRLPGLRDWLDEHPAEFRISTIATGIEAYLTIGPARSRADGQPIGGWGRYFAELDRNIFMGLEPKADLEGAADAVQRQTGRRPRVRGLLPAPKSTKRKREP